MKFPRRSNSEQTFVLKHWSQYNICVHLTQAAAVYMQEHFMCCTNASFISNSENVA